VHYLNQNQPTDSAEEPDFKTLAEKVRDKVFIKRAQVGEKVLGRNRGRLELNLFFFESDPISYYKCLRH